MSTPWQAPPAGGRPRRPPLTKRLRSRDWVVLDYIAALACAILVFLVQQAQDQRYYSSWHGLAGILVITAIALAVSVPVALRRRNPMAALVASTVAAVVAPLIATAVDAASATALAPPGFPPAGPSRTLLVLQSAPVYFLPTAYVIYLVAAVYRRVVAVAALCALLCLLIIEAVAVARRTRPDVVLMDIRMPGMDGIEATRQITGSAPLQDVRVIILTTFDLDEYVYAALRAGASGFLLKDTMPVDLLNAIKVIAAGDALLAPSVTRRLLGEFARQPDGAGRAGASGPQTPSARPGLGDLTERELEVLTLVAQGLSNSEVAGQLCISPATAKTHVAHLLTKLDCRDRVQLVIFAYRAGLVSAG